MQAKVQAVSLPSSCKCRCRCRCRRCHCCCCHAGAGAGAGIVVVIIVVQVQVQVQAKVTLSMELSPLLCRHWCWWGCRHAMDALSSCLCHPHWLYLCGRGCVVDAAAGLSGWLWWWLHVDSKQKKEKKEKKTYLCVMPHHLRQW